MAEQQVTRRLEGLFMRVFNQYQEPSPAAANAILYGIARLLSLFDKAFVRLDEADRTEFSRILAVVEQRMATLKETAPLKRLVHTQYPMPKDGADHHKAVMRKRLAAISDVADVVLEGTTTQYAVLVFASCPDGKIAGQGAGNVDFGALQDYVNLLADDPHEDPDFPQQDDEMRVH